MLTNAEMPNQWTTGDSTDILYTKLYRPPVTPDLVPRASRVAQLEALRQRPVTLISAAAGYGKSTLASMWLEAWNGSYAWLSLDEKENDLRMFLSYLLAAIRNALPQTCERTHELLNAPTFPSVTVLSRYLLNDLDQIEDPFILVLDDYHVIRDQGVHDLMAAILKYPPQNLHLIILTRRDPSLLTSVLRGRGQVNEIRTRELQFTTEETTVFLEQTSGFSVDEKTAACIQNNLEGWPAGMRLMSLSVKYSDDIGRLLAGFEGSFSTIVDYLTTEALVQLSPEIKSALAATAILDRFCAPLSDALMVSDASNGTAGIDGTTLIATLQKNNLFTIALDTENRWFRYHHMFQDALQRLLKRICSSEEIAALHSRASEWFAKSGFIDEALEHAIAADDIPYAVKLVEKHRYDLMNTEQWNRLERWIQLLPDEAVVKRPLLLAAKAFYYESRGLVAEAFTILDRIKPLLCSIPSSSTESDQAHGAYHVLLAERQYLSAEPELAIASSQKGQTMLPSEARFINYFSLLWRSLSYQMLGQSDRGLQVLNDVLVQPSMFRNVEKYKLHVCMALLHSINGDLSAAEENLLQSCAYFKKNTVKPYFINIYFFLGALNYWRGKLPEAIAYLSFVLDNRYIARPVYFAISAYFRALICLANGQPEEAKRMVESVLSHGRELNNVAVTALGRVFMVELALRQGQVLEAQRLMVGVTFDLFPPIWLDYHPQLTRVKALIAGGTPENNQIAASQLNKWHRFGRSTHNTKFLIEVLALQAVFLSKQSDDSGALNKLRDALALARPGGFIRTFVDLGPPMAELLQRLHKQNVLVDYIEQILNAFNVDAEAVKQEPDAQPAASADRPPQPSSPSQPLVEPLTNRELDVLELLAKRLQNKEIAEKLFVSTQTVKSHLKNIYQKLDVSNRRKAVAQAYRLGVINRR